MSARVHPSLLSALLPALLGGALACTPTLEPIRWQAIDIDALREAFAHPTGVVDEEAALTIADEVITHVDAYNAVADYLEEVFADDAAASIWAMPRTLDGTSVYVLVSCPGAEGQAEPFTAGSMRIDSSTLDPSLDSLDAVLGQVHLSFIDCVIAEYTFNGESPSFRDLEQAEFALEPDISYVDATRPGEEFALVRPVLHQPGMHSVLFDLGSESFVLEWEPLALELRLRGVAGSLICSIEEQFQAFVCVPP